MTVASPAGVAKAPDRRDLFGHPRGLTVLFATEMWERFSYYGMASLLTLYLVKYLLLDGHVEHILGYAAMKGAIESVFGPLDDQPFAAQLFGLYTGLAYFTPVLGGFIADRYVGPAHHGGGRRAVDGGRPFHDGVRGDAVPRARLPHSRHGRVQAERLDPSGLALRAGGRAARCAPTRSIISASISGRSSRRSCAARSAKSTARTTASRPPASACWWRPRSTCTACGGCRRTSCIASAPTATHRGGRARAAEAEQKRAIAGLIGVFALTTFFWATWDQQNITIPLWADDFTDRRVHVRTWTREIPATWFLALNPLMIFIFTPVTISRWARQARSAASRRTSPRSPSRISASRPPTSCSSRRRLPIRARPTRRARSGSSATSSIVTVGELHLAPVGLALISRLAPDAHALADDGPVARHDLPGRHARRLARRLLEQHEKPHFFMLMAAIAAAAGVAVYALTPLLRRAFQE